MIKENQRTLKELRVRYGYTQTQVADMLDVNYPTYSAMERLDNEMVEKIASIYGVEPESIYIAG